MAYKLQTAENRLSFIMQEVKTHGVGYIRIATDLMAANTDSEKTALLKQAGKGNMRELLEHIAAHTEITIRIKTSIKAPLITISLQLVAASMALWLLPTVAKKPALLDFLAWFSIVWFALGIFLAARVAWRFVVQEKNLALKEVNPALFKAVHS